MEHSVIEIALELLGGVDKNRETSNLRVNRRTRFVEWTANLLN